ncbi:MAG: glycosyl transferase [Oscillospiraceae bacterium]|nr:glycosyl transferase [Oscillospiraceae bacterium]
MIPKTIHYCWFGGAPLPEKERRCIESWRKNCPDYEIKKWDESNYDLNQNEYIRQAYKAKRWAFVTDYVRLDVIYRYGGIYLDTDVEVIRSLDPLLEDSAFAGMESVDGKQLSIATGLGFGAEPGNEIIKEWRDIYENLSFLGADGTQDLLTTPARTTACLEKRGFRQQNVIQLIDGMVIYPTEYFSPKQYDTHNIHITPNTYSIHHYSESWKSEKERKASEEWAALVKKYGKRGAEIVSAINAKKKEGGIPAVVKQMLRKLFGHRERT